jgi:anti-sigma B factor antagonist
MEIHHVTKDNVTIVDIVGEMWGRTGEPERMRALVSKLVEENNVRVVFNLSQIRLISSIGIGMLIAGYKAFTENGGAMAIAEPSDPIKPVFRVLRGPFEVFETQDEAITYVLGEQSQS